MRNLPLSRILPVMLIGLILCATAWGDAIVLKDGTRLEGTLKRVGDHWHITDADGKVTQVPVSNVRTIELGARGSSRGGGDLALASLRRSVEALTDLNQIIERFERFIANAKDPAVAEEAGKDLEMWRQRLEKGYVKQGTSWVTPEQAEEMRAQSLAITIEARDQLRVNRVAEAESLLQQALNEDPTNPAALYLRGVIRYRQDKLVDARKDFEAVNGAAQHHAPTLNNLAVILWRQNQEGGALTYYDQAMQAQPVNKFILDNVADAIGMLSEDPRRGKAAERVIRRFKEQDVLLQQQLSPQGWFRWGSTWVDRKRLDELVAAEKEVLARLAALEQEYEANQRRISEIDNHIRSNERQMRDMESARAGYRDRDGRLILLPLPQAYYDLRRENQNLRDEQQRLGARFDQLREQARRVRQQLPTPRFTGVQHLVGVEGAPLLPPLPPPTPGAAPAAAPAPSPATAPS